MENFAAYIKEGGKTRSEFARRIGISAPYLSEILSGSKRPSLDLAFKIEAETGGAVRAVDWVSPNAEEASGVTT